MKKCNNLNVTFIVFTALIGCVFANWDLMGQVPMLLGSRKHSTTCFKNAILMLLLLVQQQTDFANVRGGEGAAGRPGGD